MQEPLLRFDPVTGFYEGTFTIRVEAEILRRTAFKYIEDNNIEITNPTAWSQAIEEIAKVRKWLNHPRSIIQVSVPATTPTKEVVATPEKPASTESEYKSVLELEVDDLREKVKHIPLAEWETQLLPSLPKDQTIQEKQPIYKSRTLKRKALAILQDELEQGLLSLDADVLLQQETQLTNTLYAVAETVNSARLH